MEVKDLEGIQPYVRMIKIKKSVQMEGAWEDIDHVLIYIAQGAVDYILEGTRYHMKEGDFIIIPPYMLHIGIMKNMNPLVQYIVHFDFYSEPGRMKIPHMCADDFEVKDPVSQQEDILRGRAYAAAVHPEDRLQFERLFMSMYREMFQEKEGHVTMLRGAAIQLLTMVARCLSVKKEENHERLKKKSKSWKMVENALEYIYLHYSEELDNVRISEAVNASPNYLSKLFLDYTGMTLHTYVLNYRLDRAQRLLMTGKYNITEVAMKCGFSSIHTFSKAFKQKRGINPGAYVESLGETELLNLDKMDYDLQQKIYFNQ